ncbi:hypothetical protein EBL07_07000 [Campylobacter coli]|nr:hypothetical protein [Campylobacter coli]EAI2879172.1 hypothetical protein [Campylobacter jejuni]EAI5931685.1 hypothetical protein [Campylobacter coli]EAI7228176.1 hypothetical protein [Campylobacter coli]EAI9832139.1 hypothetical protein [Campylobacter coli]
MKKIFFILASGLSLLILYLIFDFYVLKDRATLNQTEALPSLNCDLNVESCTYDFKDRKVLVSMDPKPIQSLEVTNLKIKNLGNYENLKIRIYGLNMFMGDIMPKVNKVNETDYESKLVLAACVLELMRFRAEVLEDDKPIGFYFDFDLRR